MAKFLCTAQSVCPVCLKKIDARYVLQQEEILLQKSCEEHGFFETRVWQGEASFLARYKEPLPQKPIGAHRAAKNGCPYDCGLCENHQQASCCVLLEVTARCNMACPVCFANSGGSASAPPDPSLETILAWFDLLLEKGGPFNIQLSGGEPSLREDLPEIVEAGRRKGFPFFQINTNGLRLAEEEAFAHSLKKAGLQTVFLQFDSTREAPYQELRGRPLLNVKKKAVENCGRAGLGVVLVPTVKPGCNLQDVWSILEYAALHSPTVRGVHFQPISYFGRYGAAWEREERLTLPGLLWALEQQSGGQVQAADFMPGGAEHPLCSFHADYTLAGGRWRRVQTATHPCCGKAPPRPSSDRARQAVAQKWSPVGACSQEGPPKEDSLEGFLALQQQSRLAISGMMFQDAWTLDTKRLQHCHVHVVSPEGELVPFCAFNLSGQNGQALYRR